MSYTVREIVEIIRCSVPEELQESWDNSGIQIAFEDAPVTKIMTCLEVTEAVAAEALEKKVQLIVSHHPLIFGGVRRIDSDAPHGRILQKLIAGGVSVYSTHTPYDVVEGGNNDVLAQLLHLKDVECVTDDGFCKVGNLPEKMTFMEFAAYVGYSLGLTAGHYRCCGEGKKMISKVGLCTGAGADFFGAAIAAGCQAYVTGDVKHHEALDALAEGLCIVDAGHYGTEKFFAGSMKARLGGLLEKNVEIIETEIVTDPFNVI